MSTFANISIIIMNFCKYIVVAACLAFGSVMLSHAQTPVAAGAGSFVGATGRYVRMRGVERWYTLQGIRVGRPTAPGIYIRVRGSRAEKRLIR